MRVCRHCMCTCLCRAAASRLRVPPLYSARRARVPTPVILATHTSTAAASSWTHDTVIAVECAYGWLGGGGAHTSSRSWRPARHLARAHRPRAAAGAWTRRPNRLATACTLARWPTPSQRSTASVRRWCWARSTWARRATRSPLRSALRIRVTASGVPSAIRSAASPASRGTAARRAKSTAILTQACLCPLFRSYVTAPKRTQLTTETLTRTCARSSSMRAERPANLSTPSCTC